MEDTRSIFIATDELHTSPIIQKYASLFDVSLTLGQASLLSFVFPFRGSEQDLHKTLIHYNEDLLEILYASVYPNNDGRTATITLSIEPRDIGVSSISICTNESTDTHPTLSAYVPHVIRNKPIS